MGIKKKYQPTKASASTVGWEKPRTETRERRITFSFADDTTILGNRLEIEEGTKTIKRVMGEFEERNNEEKERLSFVTEEDKSIRMLECWIGAEEDMKNRKKRAGGL